MDVPLLFTKTKHLPVLRCCHFKFIPLLKITSSSSEHFASWLHPRPLQVGLSHRCCFSVQWVKVAGARGSGRGRGSDQLEARVRSRSPEPAPLSPSLSFSHSSRRERGMCINDDNLDISTWRLPILSGIGDDRKGGAA